MVAVTVTQKFTESGWTHENDKPTEVEEVDERDTDAYNTDDLLASIKLQHEIQHALVAKKNSDYAESTNPFENFIKTADAADMSTEQAFLFHIVNKITRLKNLIRKGSAAVESEPITDSLADLANYANLWLAYRNWKTDQDEASKF